MNALDQKAVHTAEQRLTSHRLGWPAYLPGLLGLSFFLVLWWAAGQINGLASLLVVVIGGSLFLVKALHVYSTELYADPKGIWVQRGLFPWNRGVYGVKWQDLDKATYATGFLPWATGCYIVHIGHRFTKASEITLRHVYHGDQAAQLLNRLHSELIELERPRSS